MLSLFMYLLGLSGLSREKKLQGINYSSFENSGRFICLLSVFSTELSMLMIDSIYQNGNVFLSTVRVMDGWMRDGLAAF